MIVGSSTFRVELVAAAGVDFGVVLVCVAQGGVVLGVDVLPKSLCRCMAKSGPPRRPWTIEL
jgi:hypothetical protein